MKKILLKLFVLYMACVSQAFGAALDDDKALYLDNRSRLMDTLFKDSRKMTVSPLMVSCPNAMAKLVFEDGDGREAVNMLDRVVNDSTFLLTTRVIALCNIAVIYAKGSDTLPQNVYVAKGIFEQVLTEDSGLSEKEKNKVIQWLKDIREYEQLMEFNFSGL